MEFRVLLSGAFKEFSLDNKFDNNFYKFVYLYFPPPPSFSIQSALGLLITKNKNFVLLKCWYMSYYF